MLEKTSDKFIKVNFNYGQYTWQGALPIEVRSHGFSISEQDARESAQNYSTMLTLAQRKIWKQAAKKKWKNHESQTFKVFEALLSGEWECRGCGPVPKVNPQSAARIRDIKKSGYFIASMRKFCAAGCKNSQMHDILVMIDLPKDSIKNELRKPISSQLAAKIVSTLGRKESVFDQIRTGKELIIDHKFPSQRWTRPESDNKESMPEAEIKEKFQLLNNQTNLLKSRECDRCVAEGIRGQFMGIRWYFNGGPNWLFDKDDARGCIGCPWHDVSLWKDQLRDVLKKSGCGTLSQTPVF